MLSVKCYGMGPRPDITLTGMGAGGKMEPAGMDHTVYGNSVRHGCKGCGNGWGWDWKHPCIDLYHTQQQCNGTRTKLTHRFSGFRSSDARPFQPLQQNVGVEFPNKEDGHAVTLQCRQAQSTTTISISMLAYTCSTHWACATVFHHEVTSGQARNIFLLCCPHKATFAHVIFCSNVTAVAIN